MTCSICNTPNSTRARVCAHCDAPLKLDAQYRVVGLLGRGGMNAVYRAEHTELGTPRALKEIIPDPKANPQAQHDGREQFKLEAEILARLRHEALPRVTDFFTEPRTARQYLVMELIEGETLEVILEKQNRPFETVQVVEWLKTLCEILTYLHTQTPSVIHRDIKPSNLKLTPENKLYLIDFGIAKAAPQGSKTQSGARAYSPPYSPMEQYGKGTDARSDMYALGVTGYQLLTNQLPPAAPDRLNESVLAPSALNPNVPEWLSDAILKAMAREPSDRFQTAQQFQYALASPPPASVVTPSVFAATPTLASNVTRPLPRQHSTFPWIPIALVALVGIAILFFLSSRSNSTLPPLSTTVPAAAPTRLAAQPGSVPTVFLTPRVEPTFTRTRPIPSPTRTRVSPTLARAIVPPTLTAIPPRGIVLQDWILRTQNGALVSPGGKIPPKTNFAFVFQLTNNTNADFLLTEFSIQIRAVGAAYVWNLHALDLGSIGLGQKKQIITNSLDLGAGSFIATALYRGKAITDDRNAPYQFSFQVGR